MSLPPCLEDFGSARLVFRPGDLFNPPGLASPFGCLQATTDILAVQHVTFAPYSLGEARLGSVILNDRALAAAGQPLEFHWRPDRIERSLHCDGFQLASTVVLGVRRQTLTASLRITNTLDRPQPAHLRLLAGEGVVHSIDGWKTPYSPREGPAISTTPWEGTPPAASLVRNACQPTPRGDGLLFTSRTSVACAVQAASPAPDRLERRWLVFDRQLAPGATLEVHFFAALGATAAEVLAALDAWREHPAAARAAAEADWRAELAAVFTPGNARYSGHLPVLHTANADLRALYLNAVIAVVCCRREHPASPHGRTYATLLPRYWVSTCVINDWSFSALLLVLLDPACVRRVLERWLERDVHRCFGTDYVSGANTGNWYSCNDYAMTRLVTLYVRVTGDEAWLDHRLGDRTVLDHLRGFAAHYRALDRGSGLADYGDRNSLLECVGTYEHEVASLNAANVWILRELAALLEHRRGASEAAHLRAEAAALVARVQQLYVAGGGYWQCRQPDGSLVPVRHAWDFVHTLNFLLADLPPAQLAEMVEFFRRELQSPGWMAALSPLDEDAGFSLRPDHQWNGCWPGWVSLAATGLLRAGRTDLVRQWLPGLARTAGQGPLSQAHFVEHFAPPLAGGARKAPTEWPYINDWTTVTVGNFLETVLLGVFGLEFGYATLSAQPQLDRFDPAAELANVAWHGALHRVTAAGVQAQSRPLP